MKNSILKYSFCLFAILIIAMVPALRVEAISVEIGPIELTLEPGETYSGSIPVTNDEDGTAHFRIYLGDWRQTETGDEYYEVGKIEDSLSHWMKVHPSSLTLSPGESAEVYFEISIPDDPDLTGSYWGIFFVEGEARKQEINAADEGMPNLGLRIILRHGIKVYVNIPGTEISKAEFTTAQTIPSTGGGLDFVASFENQGNTYLRPHVWLELRDQMGNTVLTSPHRIMTILPGIKRDYSFDLSGLEISPGRYTALIIADYDAPVLIAAQAEVEVKG